MGVFDKIKEKVSKKKSKEATVDPEVASMMEFVKHRQAMQDMDFDKYCIERADKVSTMTIYSTGFEGPVHYMGKDGYANVRYKHTQMEELYRDSGDYEVTHPEKGRFVYLNDNKDGYEVVRLTHENIVELQHILGLVHNENTAGNVELGANNTGTPNIVSDSTLSPAEDTIPKYDDSKDNDKNPNVDGM